MCIQRGSSLSPVLLVGGLLPEALGGAFKRQLPVDVGVLGTLPIPAVRGCDHVASTRHSRLFEHFGLCLSRVRGQPAVELSLLCGTVLLDITVVPSPPVGLPHILGRRRVV